MATGTVKKIVSERGFGFISGENGDEYFFHRSAVDASIDFDRLDADQKVDFDVEASPRGPRAVNVRSA